MIGRSFLNLLINKTLTNFTRKMSAESVAEVKKSLPKYNGKIKKRNWEDRRSDKDSEVPIKREKVAGERVKRRKYAMLLGYSGVDYYGMQRNPCMKTIEEDLLKALLKVNLITEEAFSQIQTVQFQRAARTDKGVSAARQVVSLKLPEHSDISLINNELPDQIRVFSLKRVTKGFNSKSNCDARTYIYMLPTFAFDNSNNDEKLETFRISEEKLNEVNEILKLFIGSKNFHNFTSRKQFRDPSAMRYIMSFEIEKPFIRKEVEFSIMKVKGQSFMLHQIRKMVGLAIAVARGLTTTDTILKSYLENKLDLPMAPGLGLVLDKVHYERYDARYGKDHETLDWLESEDQVNTFKENYIYPTIIDTEINEKSMMIWLEVLSKCTYSVRDPEELENQEENDINKETNMSNETEKNELKEESEKSQEFENRNEDKDTQIEKGENQNKT